MEDKRESKICQNCKKDFVVEPDDFGFYEKIKVPPPTFCPWCRFIRRMAWRNERALYKRNCDFCKKAIISTFPAESSYTVYCWDCWHGDKWDATSFGRSYDFSRSFFEQYDELLKAVPHFALWQRNAINSEYSNLVGESKNVYLSVGVVLGSENVFYSKAVDTSFNIFDSFNIKNSDGCYETIEGINNYNSQYVTMTRNCIDSYFLFDCVNCSNCFMSSNLRNKQFYIRNKKYSKEEYFKEIESFNLGSRGSRGNFIEEFQNLRENAICRFANSVLSVDSTGNNLLNTKNCKKCFDVYEAENFKYCYRAFLSKDSMDFSFGFGSELMYEYTTGAANNYNVKFSYAANSQVRDAEYTHSCIHASSLFGCVGVRDTENVILNKVYSKEEFLDIRDKIIKHMSDMPYIDTKGRRDGYGEFFPIELSPYAYNETAALDFDLLTEAETIEKGYRWRNPEEKTYSITIPSELIRDNIADVKDEIMNDVLGCAHQAKCSHRCLLVFRITNDELQFYKKNNIPLPDKCSNCRYYERFALVLPPELWKRKCMNQGCSNEFETPYAPGRPEKVFCESCYNKEVY
jgi:hypothetical protein